MRKSLSRVLLSPLAAAIVLAAASTPAFAANDNVAPALKQAMKRDLGLTDAQLGQYLKTERLAALQEKALAKAQGSSYAGSWIEKKGNGNFQFVVATTSIGAQKAPLGVEIRNMRHSLADLNASKGQLDTLLAQGAALPDGVYTWAVDLKSNSVVVGIGKGAQKAGIDFVARSGADAATIRFKTMNEAPTLRSNTQGGLGYLWTDRRYSHACSIGFNVTKGSTLGYVSAGHCGSAGTPVYLEGPAGTGPQWTLGPKLGTFAASVPPTRKNGGGPDYAWIQLDAGITQSASVYGWGSGDVTVKGSTEAAVGAAICRSGRTSGWHCGTVQSIGNTVNYGKDGIATNLTLTNACSDGGDSGGSFITGTGQAQGVLSGGSGSCDSSTDIDNCYFQPVNPILTKYGLTLKTG
jgi:streptogrisin C